MEKMAQLFFFFPELLLTLAALSLLLIGAFKGTGAGRGATHAALVALVAAAALVGMVEQDAFRLFAKILILFSGAGALILAPPFFARAAEDGHKPEYAVLVLLAVLGMLTMLGANDWIVLYVGMELQGLALYILAAFLRGAGSASEAGLKYFLLGAFSSAIMLFGLSLLYGAAGGIGFAQTAQLFSGGGGAVFYGGAVGTLLVLAGFAFKVSAVPFHMWAPDVYEGAGAPITAFLATVSKAAALAALALVLAVPLAGAAPLWRPVVIALAALSMLVGAFGGLPQQNLKRLMAYSGIANAGAMLAGLACASAEGLGGALVYLSVYIMATLGLFAVLLSLRKEGAALESVEDLEGLSQTHPYAAFGLAAALLSLAGAPPLAGFFGKYFVFLAAVKAGLWPLALLGVLSSVVAAAYYLRVVKALYFTLPHKVAERVEDSGGVRFVAVACVSFVVTLVLAPAFLVSWARLAAESLWSL